ncbi:MAG: HRDC domain-containing protein, partial [Rhodoglobus sp.]|nr:HRDC domain-containing protein [Rhodoglobus sp.]
LWLARDAYAREIDTAPGRLVPDTALVAAARVLPASKRELASLKEFTGRASRSQIDRWWNAIAAGVSTDDLPALRVASDSIPPARVWSDKNPEADRRLKRARAAVTAVGAELDIPVENLLTPELLRRVAWTPPDPIDADSIGRALTDLEARPWQIDATSQVIANAFVEAAQSPEDPPENPS